MSKMKECMMLLLRASTDEELQSMLLEDCWSYGTRLCIVEEIERRKKRIITG